LGVGYCREWGLLGERCFEGLSRGLRGDALACRGHPYMFLYNTPGFYNLHKFEGPYTVLVCKPYDFYSHFFQF
jgi:hypothetical protein